MPKAFDRLPLELAHENGSSSGHDD